MSRCILSQVEDAVARLCRVYFVDVLGHDAQRLSDPSQVAAELLEELRNEETRPPVRTEYLAEPTASSQAA